MSNNIITTTPMKGTATTTSGINKDFTTPPKSNSPVNNADYYKNDWSLYGYNNNYANYTKEEYDMEFMNYEYSGYRAGYSHELYSWYHSMYQTTTRNDLDGNNMSNLNNDVYDGNNNNSISSLQHHTPPKVEPGARRILGEDDPNSIIDNNNGLSTEENGTNLGQQQQQQQEQHDELQQEPTAERNVLFTVRALADYEKSDETEMDLFDGELLSVFYKDESGWWEARSERTGLIGWIPSNFVQVKHEMWTIYEDDLSGELDEDGEEYDDNAF